MGSLSSFKRNPTLDVLRAYAIFLVMFSHVFAPVCDAMNLYSFKVWVTFIVLDAGVRLCVPIFVMISGKLLLSGSPDEPPLVFLKKRLLKIIPSFIVWSLLYAYYEARMNGTPFSWVNALLQMAQGPTEFHLWFVYMIIGLYLMTPILRRVLLGATNAQKLYIVVIWFVYLCLQFLFPSYVNSGPSATILGFSGYFVLGAILDGFDWRFLTRGRLLAICVVTIAVNALGTIRLVTANGGQLDETWLGYLTPLVALYAVAFYLWVQKFDVTSWFGAHPFWEKAVTRFSLESYNLYLIHVVFIWLFIKGHLGFVLNENTGGHPFLGVPLTFGAILGCTWILSRFLQHIPIVNRLAVIPIK